MKKRQEQINDWIGKGAEWLAKKLYNATRDNNTLSERLQQYRYNHGCNDDFEAIKTANKNMAKVIQDNGIRPTHLTVKYMTNDCKSCPYEPGPGQDAEECNRTQWEEACPLTSGAVSRGFYFYEVDDEGFDGITSLFESANYDAVKVINDNTGEVIYERGEYDADEEWTEDED